jgi:NTP pyrophosphatase (non-canonical NTP hydrolase)
MHLAELQDLMERTYGTRDRDRGLPAAVAWLAEEVGELAQALRKGSIQEQRDEFADVLAWVATLANIAGVDLDAALERFAGGCPKCGGIPCHCGGIAR